MDSGGSEASRRTDRRRQGARRIEVAGSGEGITLIESAHPRTRELRQKIHPQNYLRMLGYIVSAIASLLGWSGPSAIVWAVWAFIVNAVQGISRSWFASHVGKKVWEGIFSSPSFADCYAASAPFCISLGPRIMATVAHIGPCPVFGTALAVPVIAVAKSSLSALKPSDMIGIRFSFVNASGHAL